MGARVYSGGLSARQSEGRTAWLLLRCTTRCCPTGRTSGLRATLSKVDPHCAGESRRHDGPSLFGDLSRFPAGGVNGVSAAGLPELQASYIDCCRA